MAQMLISSTLTSVIICLLILYGMTIFITGVNIIEESMKVFEQSMKTSMDLMNSVGQPVPENVEQQMRDSISNDPNLMPSASCYHVNHVYLFIHFSCTAFCKTL